MCYELVAGEQIWADCVITIDSNLNTYPNGSLTHALSAGTDDEIVESIHTPHYLFPTTHNTKPKIIISGGLDTATLWAYLDLYKGL